MPFPIEMKANHVNWHSLENYGGSASESLFMVSFGDGEKNGSMYHFGTVRDETRNNLRVHWLKVGT